VATDGERWAFWLETQLEDAEMKPADLVRRSGTKSNGRPVIDAPRVSGWLKGERPSYRLAVVAAQALGVPRRDALRAAGYDPGEEDDPDRQATKPRGDGEVDRRSVAELIEAGEAPLLSLDPEAIRGLTDEQQAVVIREAQEHALRVARLLRGDR
jgi:transcriptional regulator with XRE-family HTH domain